MDIPQEVTSSIELKVGTFVDLDGIESAITSTTFALKDAEDQVTRLILQEHLKKLCKLQRTVLSVVGETDQPC